MVSKAEELWCIELWSGEVLLAMVLDQVSWKRAVESVKLLFVPGNIMPWHKAFYEWNCLGWQLKLGGKFHLKLNIDEIPIEHKYHEERMHRILKRELKSTWNHIYSNGSWWLNRPKQGRMLQHGCWISLQWYKQMSYSMNEVSITCAVSWRHQTVIGTNQKSATVQCSNLEPWSYSFPKWQW